MECTSCHMSPSLTTVLPLKSLLITAFLTVTSQIPALMHWKVVDSPGSALISVSAHQTQWTAHLMQAFFWMRWLVEGRRRPTVFLIPMRAARMMRNSAMSLRCPPITGKRITISLTPRRCSTGRRGGCHTRSVGKLSWQTGSGAGVNQREHPDRYSGVQSDQFISLILNH